MREGVDAHHADVLRSTTARSDREGEFAETSASRCKGARELAGRSIGYRTTLPRIAAGAGRACRGRGGSTAGTRRGSHRADAMVQWR
jgi:hypothetical protein